MHKRKVVCCQDQSLDLGMTTERRSSLPHVFGGIVLGFFVVFFLVSQDAPAPVVAPPDSAASMGVVPESVRRPSYFDASVYPRDISIGDLGLGDASPVAYGYVNRVLLAVQNSEKSSALLSTLPSKDVDNMIAEVAKISSRKLRVGGGEVGVDGAHSFNFRFMGREDELTGAIYVHENGSDWVLEEIMMEMPRSIEEARASDDPYLHTFTDRMY